MTATEKRPELNFEEAEQHAYRAWADPRELPYEAQAAIDAAVAEDAATATDFSLMLKAIADFMKEDNDGLPPLQGAIPDMHADTARYVTLQKAYVTRAMADAVRVKARVIPSYVALLSSLGRKLDDEAAARLQTLCKHVRDVKVVTTKSLMDEMERPDLDEASTALFEAEDEITKLQTPVLWYIALRAADRFFVKRQRWPGASAAQIDEDAEAIAREIDALLVEGLSPRSGTESAFEGAFKPAHAREMARFGGAELHAVAAVVGGVASQEAVKIIAKQYTPINHTYLYNGIACTAATLEP